MTPSGPLSPTPGAVAELALMSLTWAKLLFCADLAYFGKVLWNYMIRFWILSVLGFGLASFRDVWLGAPGEEGAPALPALCSVIVVVAG